MFELRLRPVALSDNPVLAAVIREVLEGMGVPKVGTAYADPELDQMYQAYLRPGSCYWVVERRDGVRGGGGVAHLRGAGPDICEVQKMYLHPDARGRGMGARLLGTILDWAVAAGYRQAYIETMPYMEKAQQLYRDFGFTYLPGPLGNTGHYSCPIHMIREL